LDADSGGGKTLVGLALRIALSKFVGSSILFLDEICASLDVPNLTKLMKSLVALIDDGFRQIFVITHRREIAETLSHNLLATRDQDKQCTEIDWM
jgi:DNA repair exonuclease SbcCD ATPase subunit